MGYVTRFGLDVDLVVNGQVAELVNNNPLVSTIDELRKSNSEAEYCLDSDGFTANEGKWYDYQKDLVEFSKKHPSVLFTLHGEGEENSDVWRLYVFNGKAQMERAKMNIAPVDFSKLK